MSSPEALRLRPCQTATTLLLFTVLCLVAGPQLAAQSKSANSSTASDVAANQALRGKKLFLKDGTYQVVREYQVIGDRVRYYSVERSAWEEIPSSMVDWDATQAAAGATKERQQRTLALAHRVDLENHPGSMDAAAGLGLPTGVLLPSGDGMYAFNGSNILSLKLNLAHSKLNKGRYIAKLLSPIPVVATRYTIYLDGKQANTRIANSEPVFYFRTSRNSVPRFQLIRARAKNDTREIEFLSENLGQKKTDAEEIPVNLRQVDPDTYRLTATQDLPPGEYVLAQKVPGQDLDLYVWDFGIDRAPSKPSNKK